MPYCRFESCRTYHYIMKLAEGAKIEGNPVLVSDHGYAWIIKLKDGTIGCEGYSIARQSLTDEERDMYDKPKEIYEEFFRQQTQDDV